MEVKMASHAFTLDQQLLLNCKEVLRVYISDKHRKQRD